MRFASIMRSSALLSFLGIALCACSVEDSSAEGIATSSEPLTSGSPATNYPEAVTITTSSGPCTGTLISGKVVLTSGACAAGSTSWTVNVGTWTVHFGAVTEMASRAATLDAEHDVGLVFLPMAQQVAFPTIAPSAYAGGPATIVGGGSTSTLLSTNVNELVSTGNPSFPFDLFVIPSVTGLGDSGGPVFEFGTHTIVGVNSLLSPGAVARVDNNGDTSHAWVTQPIDNSTFFVTEQYLDVLNRAPDAAGFQFWLGMLEGCNGNTTCLASTRVEVARGFFESTENVNEHPELNPASANYPTSYVTDCYWDFLRRAPDAAGLTSLVSVFNTMGNNAVISDFINSPEYRQRFGAQ
jgi:hypothetical protein